MADTIPDPDERFVTLVELAAFLQAAPSATDEMAPLLNESLDAALERVTEMVGPLEDAVVEYRLIASRGNLLLPDTDLREVVTVTDPTGTVVTPGHVYLGAGIVTVPRQIDGEWTVTAKPRVPGAPIALAVKIIASHLFGLHRGNAGGRASVSVQPVADTSGRSGFAIPSRAAELLEPYLRPGI